VRGTEYAACSGSAARPLAALDIGLNPRNTVFPGEFLTSTHSSDLGSCTLTSERPGTSQPRLIVGIGASAGGLQALEQFFDKMPSDSDLAFVVVQHLSPDFKSVLVELLGRHTGMQVASAEDGMPVQANHVYLLPPKKDVEILEGKLRVADRPENEPVNLLIDRFFRSLAIDQGIRSAVIVLSGTGSDGSRSLVDVDAHDGLIVVQDPASANFDGMPQSAIGTGLVDIVCTPEMMPAALVDHATESLRTASSARRARYVSGRHSAFPGIFETLNSAFGIDFGFYKPSTINRRIERRMQMLEIDDFDQYGRRLESDAKELDVLYHDLLIGVTHFFRDPEVFTALESRVLARVVDESPELDVRVWVCGCATGEEAYSIAILMNEAIEQSGSKKRLKVFATDVHGGSLEVASNGVYPESALTSVRPDLLEKYFVSQDDGYRVVTSLRQQIVFSSHNVLNDPPFTRIDLVTCRNLLIYFESQAQKMALSMLHFALRKKGVLFLGSSETLGTLERSFDPIDAKLRLWSKRHEQSTSESPRFHLGAVPPHRVTMPRTTMDRPAMTGRESALLRAYDAVLEKTMPPSLLVDENRTLVHAFGDAGRYFGLVSGRPTYDLLQLVHDDLRVALSMGLQKAQREKKKVVFERVEVKVQGEVDSIDVSIDPIERLGEDGPLYLITFNEPTTMRNDDFEVERISKLDIDDRVRERMSLLERELDETRSNLHAMVEELETSNEELQATNEEMMASNEELQSTNEELHSVNEELYTVNAEYEQKNAELQRLASDMDNLLRSTDIGTVFVDRELKIREFTPAIGKTLRLLPQDVGRPIDHIALTIEGEGDLTQDLHEVIETAGKIEREVKTRDGHWLLQRILPYLDSDNRVDGAVVTFVDIDRLKRAAQFQDENVQLANERATLLRRLQSILANIGQLTYEHDMAEDSIRWTGGLILGYKDDELPKHTEGLQELLHPDDRRKVEEQFAAAVAGERRFDVKCRVRHRDGHYLAMHDRGVVHFGESGEIESIIGVLAKAVGVEAEASDAG